MEEGISELEFGAHKKLLKLVGANKRVLEIGCGKGFVSERLQQNGCSVTAIEIDESKAAEARKRCEKVFVGDIEDMELKFKPECFDILLFADVLEHLKYPDAVLQKLKKFLRKDGAVIASIPNVGNWKVRLNLLFGKFDLQEQGILDRTHLHFYTMQLAKKLIEGNGYKIERMDFVPSGPIPNPFHLNYVDRLKQAVSRFFPALFSFQFLIVARKV